MEIPWHLEEEYQSASGWERLLVTTESSCKCVALEQRGTQKLNPEKGCKVRWVHLFCKPSTPIPSSWTPTGGSLLKQLFYLIYIHRLSQAKHQKSLKKNKKKENSKVPANYSQVLPLQWIQLPAAQITALQTSKANRSLHLSTEISCKTRNKSLKVAWQQLVWFSRLFGGEEWNKI